MSVWRDLRENWRSVLLAVVLHAVLIGLLLFSINFGGIIPTGGSNPDKVVSAVVVNPGKTASKPEPIAPEKKPEEPPKPEETEQQKQKKAEAERKAREQAQAKAEQARQKAEAERKAREAAQRKAEAERKAKEEAQRKAEALARKKAEAKRKAEEEAKRKAKEAAERKAEEEAERKAREAAKRKAEEEARRKAEAEREAQEEAKRQAAAEARRRREALQKQLAAEAQASELSELRNKYVTMIKNHVEANWLRPPGAGNIKCRVKVEQLPGGQVVGVELLNSCGSDAVDRSVEQAIRRSDPLPRPPDRRVFERELIFTFQPQ